MKRNRKGKAGLLDLLREVNAEEVKLGRLQALSDYYSWRCKTTADRRDYVLRNLRALSRSRSKSFVKGYKRKIEELGVC